MSADLLAGTQWWCAPVAPGHDMPELGGAQWYPAPVPGTAAAAVRAAEGAAAALARDYDAEDWWFVTTVADPGVGPWELIAQGLATVAQVWVDETQLASSESMFVRLEVALDGLRPGSTIALRFAALTPLLRQRRPRGRWRSALVREQGLRWWRTSLWGRAPLFTGTAAPVGPWQAIELRTQRQVRVLSRTVHTTVDGADGVLSLRARLRLADDVAPVARVAVGGSVQQVQLERNGEDLTLRAEIVAADVELWWPNGYGAQALYPLTVTVAGQELDWGRVGFRTLAVDRSDGGFALSINGVGVFCRGACWTPLDPVGLLAEPEHLRATLVRARDAGFTMLRITGTIVYEHPLFWQLCAELGLLVWQDAMLATLDPPEDEQFTALLRAEIEQLCTGLQGNPALAVLSGGSETEQQPALLGLPAQRRQVPAVQQLIPAIVDRLLPGVPYVSSSPSGGPLPTHVGTGIAHYFGVGAYLRGLDDVRSARVRFAAECLTFSAPPERAAVDEAFGSAAVAGHHPRWKAAVPRDNGASWDFEDVRDHYVRTLFSVDPSEVRRADPERYLDLGRAAVCEAVEHSFSYWRRPDSGCAGALVLTLRDLEPGAGWGLLDSAGEPKAPWYVLRRLCQPVAVLINDEGLDGLRIDVLNDRPTPLQARLQLLAHRRSGAGSTLAEQDVSLTAGGAGSYSVDELAGAFLDLNHAYKFGPRAYDAVSVRLLDGDRELSSAVRLLGSPAARAQETDIGLSATAAVSEQGCWTLTVATCHTAQYVSIDIAGFSPEDSWFHLPASGRRSVALHRSCAGGAPRGYVRALNSTAEATVRVPR